MREIITLTGVEKRTGNRIIDSIYNNPEQWHITEYYFYHDKGFKFWIGNGFTFFKPQSGTFGFWDKLKAWKAYKWWMKNVPVDHK